MQRWAELLSSYQYRISGKRTHEIPHADALSRLPVSGSHRTDREATDTVDQISALDLALADGFPITWDKIAKASESDVELRQVKRQMLEGKDLEKRFHRLKERLSCEGEVVLMDSRVVIPTELQAKVLEFLHCSHPGIQAMKAWARQTVWWPGMESEIERCVAQCPTCQRIRPSQKPCLKPWPEPKENWSRVHADLGQLDGKNFLVVADAKSAFVAAEWLKETDSRSVIRSFRRIFCNFGLPRTLVTDNGSQFVAGEMEDWLDKMGIEHLKSPRYHPASNGVAEAAVKRLKCKLKQLSDPDQEIRLLQALYALRICPRANAPAPCREMFGRDFGTRLTQIRKKRGRHERHDQESKVWLQDPFSKEWREGILREAAGEQLRHVTDEQGRNLVVHRDHVRARAACDASSEAVQEEKSGEQRYPKRIRQPPDRFHAI